MLTSFWHTIYSWQRSPFWKFWDHKMILYKLDILPVKFDQIRSTFNFPAFFPFPWQRSPFWKFWDHKMILYKLDILPVKFDQIRSTFNFPAFFPFPWQRSPFWKFQLCGTHLLINPNIPVKFYQFWLISKWDMARTNFWRKKKKEE